MAQLSVKPVLLSSEEFKAHPTYRAQVAKLIDQAFQRDKLEGDRLSSYSRALVW